MRFIKEVKIVIPGVNQEFELGDLTIFIGRPNSNKTRILNQILNQAGSIPSIVARTSESDRINRMKRLGVLSIGEEDAVKKMKVLMIPSQRNLGGDINSSFEGLDRTNQSVKKMDPTIEDLGNQNVIQLGEHRKLGVQGSGVQNISQIISQINLDKDFILIDEPEISQFPSGKIEILGNVLKLLGKKQIVLATHDPTLINQYLIKKILGESDHKIIVHSFCGDKFSKIDFDCNLDPEIHCGYLSQTFSGKPIHLVVEGKTEFYTFQALLHKYYLERNVPHFPNKINKISLSYLAGNQWKINIHHLPPPEHYTVLLVLDGEKIEEVNSHTFNDNFEIINSITEAKDDKINLICLKAENIEKAFEGIFKDIVDFPKPFGLSEVIWKSQDPIIEKLRTHSDESKQIYEIIDWIARKA